jgi:hypothetical protein
MVVGKSRERVDRRETWGSCRSTHIEAKQVRSGEHL